MALPRAVLAGVQLDATALRDMQLPFNSSVCSGPTPLAAGGGQPSTLLPPGYGCDPYDLAAQLAVDMWSARLSTRGGPPHTWRADAKSGKGGFSSFKRKDKNALLARSELNSCPRNRLESISR